MAQPKQVSKSAGVKDAKEEVKSPSEGLMGTIAVKTKATCVQLRDRTTTLVKDPHFQKVTIATTSGMVVLGAAGGAFGLASGIVIGSAAGLPPALLTFGLSIPVCGAMGGAGGLATGTVLGGGAGGCAGFAAYKYRMEIQEGIVVVKVKALKAAGATKVKVFALKDQALDLGFATKGKALSLIHDTTERASLAVVSTKVKASAKAKEAWTFASTTKAGVTTASAATGGAIGSTAGGGTGAIVGGAVGLVPALFTFGLSIPMGASIGLCCGAMAGGSFGIVSGGALGYGGFTYRKELGDVKSKIGIAAGEVKSKVGTAAAQMTRSATDLVCSSTGGSQSPKMA